MTDRIDPSTLTDRRDLAAYWHARLHSDAVSQEDRLAFEQWRQADPANARQYQVVADLWTAACALPKDEVRKLGARPRAKTDARARPTPWQWLGGAALACGTALLVVAADPAGWRDAASYDAEFSTVRGERREIALPDNSVLLLNTDTRATVRFFKDRRTVQLAQGEILFQVDGKQGTPFIVQAGEGSVRVTGTRFDVRRDADAFAVSVLEGAVEVRNGPWWHRWSARLLPGSRAQADGSGGLRVEQAADVDNATAWRGGKIVFRETAMADAVRELNRYAGPRIRAPEARVRDFRVSGVFSVDDVPAFLDALPRIAPVTVQTRPDGQIEILAR